MVWKFEIDFDNNPEHTKGDIRKMIAAAALEGVGDIRIHRDTVVIEDFDDAFNFRMQMGHLTLTPKREKA